MKLVKNYMADDTMRAELNRLAGETFGINFEYWYRFGGWKGQYVPYSIFSEDGKILANVSVNIIDCDMKGSTKHFIQLGTVMTDKACRKKGYASDLIRAAADDMRECDGIYLYGNDFATPFYKKIGFTGSREYSYTYSGEKQNGACGFTKLDTNDEKARESFFHAVNEPAINYALQVKNPGLELFHTQDFENMFYSKELDCYICAELKGEVMVLHSIISPKRVKIKEIAEAFGSGISEIRLGFAPLRDEEGNIESETINEEDSTFLIMGDELKEIRRQSLRFPEFSHA